MRVVNRGFLVGLAESRGLVNCLSCRLENNERQFSGSLTHDAAPRGTARHVPSFSPQRDATRRNVTQCDARRRKTKSPSDRRTCRERCAVCDRTRTTMPRLLFSATKTAARKLNSVELQSVEPSNTSCFEYFGSFASSTADGSQPPRFSAACYSLQPHDRDAL